MGIMTTHHLTREDALNVLRRAPYDTFSADELAALLEEVYGPAHSDPSVSSYRVARRGPPADLTAEQAAEHLTHGPYDQLSDARLGDLLDLLLCDRDRFANYLITDADRLVNEAYVTTAEHLLNLLRTSG